MNNKPVAWMFEYGTDRGDAVNGISWYSNVHFKKPDLIGLIRNIEPLYTHPADLTDGEIERVYFQTESVWDKNGNFEYLEFARAILRKAQEK